MPEGKENHERPQLESDFELTASAIRDDARVTPPLKQNDPSNVDAKWSLSA